ncbi:MAG: hypothetical protein EXR72_06780 [Myxococcales bacterium]|nr:hypothetical protein [Myxococcales bacterium]
MDVPAIGWPALSALMAALGGVAVSDIRYRRIPNLLVAVIAVAGVGHAVVAGGAGGLGAALLGGAAGVALLYFQFTKGLMGAGDVKLLGAMGTWAGALGALYILLIGSILGGVLAVGALILAPRRQRAEVGHNLLYAALNHELPVPAPADLPRPRGVPFGVALAISAAGFLYMKVAP